jgi:hypothetical protein
LEPDRVVAVPLTAALLVAYDCDAHFTLYTTPAEVRLRKHEPLPAPVLFQFAAADLDFDSHRTLPTLLDFASLVRSLYVMGSDLPPPTPNVVYETRGGARVLYLIEPLTDPAEFEAHYHALLAKVAEPLANAGCPYQVDLHARDWTRLFRAPRVVRDGVAEHHRQVRQFHGEVLDLRKFKVKPRPARATCTGRGGQRVFTGADPYLAVGLKGLREGNRNCTVYRLLCHVRDRYQSGGIEKCVEIIRERALGEGMEEREFESTLRSVFK